VAFTWTHTFSPGGRIEAAGVVEIYNNIKAIAQRAGVSLTWNYNPVSVGQIVKTEQVEELRQNVDALYDCSVDAVNSGDDAYCEVDAVDAYDSSYKSHDAHDNGYDAVKSVDSYCAHDGVDNYDSGYDGVNTVDIYDLGYCAADSIQANDSVDSRDSYCSRDVVT